MEVEVRCGRFRESSQYPPRRWWNRKNAKNLNLIAAASITSKKPPEGSLYSGNLIECGPCWRRCVPPRLTAEVEREKIGFRWRQAPAAVSARGLDPVQVLGSILMQEMILPKLESVDLAQCLAVSKSWRSCAVHDPLWKKRCEKLSYGQVVPWCRYYLMYKVLVLDVDQRPKRLKGPI